MTTPIAPERGPRSGGRPGASRRRRLQTRAKTQVGREHRRLIGSPRADLRRTLIERFLERNLKGLNGPILEIGPGEGRFTRVVLRSGKPTVLLDLARPMLQSARRHLKRRTGEPQPWGYLQGAAEDLAMFRKDSWSAVVLVGFFGMLANDAPKVLRSLAQVVQPGGRVIIEAQGPSNAVQENCSSTERSQYPTIRRLYSDIETYHLQSIIREGYQPHDPSHWANFEYRFWRPEELRTELRRTGFAVLEQMSLGPGLGVQAGTLGALRRNPRAWRNLLETEEVMGHWPECLGSGPAYLVSAERRR